MKTLTKNGKFVTLHFRSLLVIKKSDLFFSFFSQQPLPLTSASVTFLCLSLLSGIFWSGTIYIKVGRLTSVWELSRSRGINVIYKSCPVCGLCMCPICLERSTHLPLIPAQLLACPPIGSIQNRDESLLTSCLRLKESSLSVSQVCKWSHDPSLWPSLSHHPLWWPLRPSEV